MRLGRPGSSQSKWPSSLETVLITRLHKCRCFLDLLGRSVHFQGIYCIMGYLSVTADRHCLEFLVIVNMYLHNCTAIVYCPLLVHHPALHSRLSSTNYHQRWDAILMPVTTYVHLFGFLAMYLNYLSRDSTVGIATGYGLEFQSR
jgi:hypothetical protein